VRSFVLPSFISFRVSKIALCVRFNFVGNFLLGGRVNGISRISSQMLRFAVFCFFLGFQGLHCLSGILLSEHFR